MFNIKYFYAYIAFSRIIGTEMNEVLLYQDSYTYELKDKQGRPFFHVDYGARTEQVNMVFQHFHKFYEIFILLQGNCHHIIEGQMYPVEPLDIVIIKPFLLHKTFYGKGKESRRLIITFNLNMLQQNFGKELEQLSAIFELEVPILRGNDQVQVQLKKLLNSLFLSSLEDTAVKGIKTYSLFLEFLYTLYTIKKINVYISKQEDNPILEKILQITAYLHTHYEQQINLDTIAEQFSISRYYLAHQFKRVTGFTFTNYLQLIRVRRAQEMLLTSDLRVIDICDQCGFGSLSQFNRIFLENSNISPLKYRKQFQG